MIKVFDYKNTEVKGTIACIDSNIILNNSIDTPCKVVYMILATLPQGSHFNNEDVLYNFIQQHTEFAWKVIYECLWELKKKGLLYLDRNILILANQDVPAENLYKTHQLLRQA